MRIAAPARTKRRLSERVERILVPSLPLSAYWFGVIVMENGNLVKEIFLLTNEILLL